MNKAKVVDDCVILAAAEVNDEGVSCLAVDCYNGVQYRALPDIVEWNGAAHGKIGWNHQCRRAFYTDAVLIGRIVTAH